MINKNFNICSECFEAITNPICVDCIEKEVDCWLDQSSYSVKKAVKSEFKKLRQTTKDIGQTTPCVVCRKNAEVCPFCLVEDLKNRLGRILPNKSFREFSMLFNFSNFGEY
jgi:hypothetical protein